MLLNPKWCRLHLAAAAWLLLCCAVFAPTPVQGACELPCYNNQSFPVKTLPGGLKPDMFGAFTCLIDPSVDCRLSDDFVNPPAGREGLPINSWDKDKYCDSCLLYFRHCTKPDGSINTGPLKFVENKAAISASSHTLVMPNKPCHGVEEWKSARCGGEGIWDAGLNTYTTVSGGGKVTDFFLYVLAVNCMHKRSQHQLHMHVGKLATGLQQALKDGRKWAAAQTPTPATEFRIKCAKKDRNPTPPIDCKFDAATQLKDGTVVVTIAKANSPAAATPFTTIYGPPSNPPNTATIFNSMGVVASANGEWLILQLLDGAAECLLVDDQGKCTQKKAVLTRAADDAAVAGEGEVAAAAAAEGAAAAAEGVEPAPADDGSSSSGGGNPGRRLML